MRRILLPLLAATAVLSLTTPALAKTHVAVGIGDQSAAMFTQPNFRALHIRKARYFIRWDAIRHRDAMAAADAYVAAARRAHVRVLMHISTNDLRHKKAKLPSVRSYKRYVGRLVRHFKRKGVHDWGTWNEENHKSQPTYRSPTRAAQYFKTMHGLCRGCHIVALDILDQAGATRYIRRFYHALGSRWTRRATIVGIHNYSDTNRFRDRGTKSILRTVKHYNRHTQFWLTETGGVVNFGRSFPCSTSRASRAVKYMFTLVKRHRRDIKRLYSYNWFGTNPSCQGFDAGLVNADGSARPGYTTFKHYARSYSR